MNINYLYNIAYFISAPYINPYKTLLTTQHACKSWLFVISLQPFSQAERSSFLVSTRKDKKQSLS